MTAIRLARTVTNRNKIALFSDSYHGHLDGTLVERRVENGTLQAVPRVLGIPPNIVPNIVKDVIPFCSSEARSGYLGKRAVHSPQRQV